MNRKKFRNFDVVCSNCGATDSTDVNCKIVTKYSGGEEQTIVTIFCKCGNKEDLT